MGLTARIPYELLYSSYYYYYYYIAIFEIFYIKANSVSLASGIKPSQEAGAEV